MKKGEVDFLTPAELSFWKDLIDKYLYPIDANKEEEVKNNHWRPGVGKTELGLFITDPGKMTITINSWLKSAFEIYLSIRFSNVTISKYLPPTNIVLISEE